MKDDLNSKRALKEASQEKIKYIKDKIYEIDIILTDSYDLTNKYVMFIKLQLNETAQKNITVAPWIPPKCPETFRNISAVFSPPSSFGVLTITFNETMTDMNSNLDFNYSQLISNETLDIYLDPKGNWQDDIDNFNMSNLNFTWNVTKYENRTLTIQLKFNDAL